MPRISETPRREKGFSLVEIMVGMVIGMLGMLIVLQSSVLFEDQKRRTTSGAEAMENGLVAMTIIERDLRMAGYGLTNSNLLGKDACPTLRWWFDGVAHPTSSPTDPDRISDPVRITDGGGGLSDSIDVTIGEAMSGTSPAKLDKNEPNDSNLKVNRTTGFNKGDLIIVAQNKVCTMVQISDVNPKAFKLQHNSEKEFPYNPPKKVLDDWGWDKYTTGALIFNIGPPTTAPINHSYWVENSILKTKQLDATPDDLELVSDIVNIQAQYGIAPAGSNVVNCWVNATPGGNACDGNDWKNPSVTDVARIKAVRIAVVARSTLPEKPSVTGGACDATANAPQSWSGGPAIDLTADPNWQCYRYRTYQTIVPLRNVIWANL